MAHHQNQLYPIFLRLEKLETIIAGGGLVALEKLSFMLKSSPNARVTVVSPQILPEIEMLASIFTGVKLRYKRFSLEDLIDQNLLIVATNDRELNKNIKEEAAKRGIIANVADTPEHCDFYLGSIVTRGDLKIAISTNGKAPAFAKRFRQVLEEILPSEIPLLIQNLGKIRKTMKGTFSERVKILSLLTSNLAGKTPPQEKKNILERTDRENHLVFSI